MLSMVKEEFDENQNISEVSIYKRDEVFLKIEPGTPLKLLKLLCESEGVKTEHILGVKPKQVTNGISCISTLDDTRLFEQEYQLILNAGDIVKESECTECLVRKSKKFSSIGVNTENDILGITMTKTEWRRNSPPIFTSRPPSGDYYRSKTFSPPQLVLSTGSSETHHSYKAIQEATKKLYSRQPGIGSISYDYLPSSYSAYEKSRNYISRSPTRSGESVIKSVPAFKSSVFKHADSAMDLESSDKVREEKYKRSKDEYNKTHEQPQDSPPALLRFHENGDRRHLFEMSHAKGEEPPVFVLPNDFDATTAPGDIYGKRDHHLNVTTTPYGEQQFSPSNRSPNPKSPFYMSPKQQNTTDYHYGNETPTKPEKKDSPKRNYSPDSSTGSEGKLRCKICNRTFATKSLLYKHLRGHTSDEKPFKCSECGQGFTLSSNLRQHRIIHRGYKPFQCEFCGKKFMRSNVYKQHRRIHTGEEMHKCTLCPSEFLQKYALVKHMKKNHDIEANDI